MRILLVGIRDSRNMGGSLSILETIAASLSRRGHHVEILFVYGGAASVSASRDYRVSFLRSSGPTDIKGYIRFWRLLRSMQPEVVHFVDSINCLAIFSSLIYGYTVLHVHGREWGVSFLFWMMCRIKYHYCSAILAITHGAKRSLIELGLASPGKIFILPNAIHYRFTVETKSHWANSSRSSSKVVLGFASRHNSCKSPEEAIRLMEYLPANYILKMAGDGEQTDQMKRLASRLSMSDRIEFVGTVNDLHDFYSGLNMYLFFSKYEPFGLVLAEAMMMGALVVGLRGEGEYFEPEYPLITVENSMLIPRRNPFLLLSETSSDTELKALALVILSLVGDGRSCSTMRLAARRTVEESFHPDRIGRNLEVFYQALCQDRLSSLPSCLAYTDS